MKVGQINWLQMKAHGPFKFEFGQGWLGRFDYSEFIYTEGYSIISESAYLPRAQKRAHKILRKLGRVIGKRLKPSHAGGPTVNGPMAIRRQGTP
jgi:hypothetical protein